MNIFILEVVEAWLCDIDRLPKLSPANSRLNNRDLYIHITRETAQLHPSTGENISPPLGGETLLSAFRCAYMNNPHQRDFQSLSCAISDILGWSEDSGRVNS
jgi:hypothetical protein